MKSCRLYFPKLRHWQSKFKHCLRQSPSQNVLPHPPYGVKYHVFLLLTIKTWVTSHPPTTSTTIESHQAGTDPFQKVEAEGKSPVCHVVLNDTAASMNTSRKLMERLESTYFASKLRSGLCVLWWCEPKRFLKSDLSDEVDLMSDQQIRLKTFSRWKPVISSNQPEAQGPLNLLLRLRTKSPRHHPDIP